MLLMNGAREFRPVNEKGEHFNTCCDILG